MFIARQPIFNKSMEVFGYELLYRSGSDSKGFDGTSSSHATASVIGGLFESGIDQIVDDKRAFINFDAAFISSDLPELISLCNQMNIDEGNLYTAYLDSVKWAAEIVHMMYQKL